VDRHPGIGLDAVQLKRAICGEETYIGLADHIWTGEGYFRAIMLLTACAMLQPVLNSF
jgi:hypothetical protein